jgi:N6-L-threonylcarbamoyladenine synthase
MTILGIDTTGFSTAFSVVKDGKEVLFNFVNPGYKLNKEWNEVVKVLPELHFDFLMKNFEKILEKNNLSWKDIDAIAVSGGSGIESCITMGKCFAKTYSEKNNNKKIIEVDHVLAHMYSTWIEKDYEKFKFPILTFSSSGSHNSIGIISDKKYFKNLILKDIYDLNDGTKFHLGIGKYFYRLYSLLGLEEEENGWQKFFKLMEEGNPKKYDSLNLKVKRHYGFKDNVFDFSDLMHGLNNFIEEKKKNNELTEEIKKDIAASFQEIISEIIAEFLLFLTRFNGIKEVHLSGGLSMNKCVVNRVKRKIGEEFPKVKILIPKKEYRLDNAAMIASLAYFMEKNKIDFKNFKPIVTK